MSGRELLDNTLSDLVTLGREEDQSSFDEEVEEGARDLLRLPGGSSTCYSPNASKPEITTKVIKVKASLVRGTPIRRRRKKLQAIAIPDRTEDAVTDSSNSRHVMTFFDRRVDLAQFSPAHPLYAMCRCWMRNNPSSTTTPAVSSNSNGDHDVLTTAGVSNNIGPTHHRPPVQQVSSTGEEVHHLPGPALPVKDSDGQLIRLDIPPPPNNKPANDDYTQYTGGSMDVTEMRAAHLKRWKRIKQSWIHASRVNQGRYAESLEILRNIYC